MKIGGVTIRTPYDPGFGVVIDPDWRRKVALAWLEDRGRTWVPPPEIYDDKYIRRYVEYLKFVMANPNSAVPERYKSIQNAEAWYADGETGFMQSLEPVLLTSVPYGIIIKDFLPLVFSRKPSAFDDACLAVQAYERLFFNIRDEDGLLNESIHSRTLFALRGFELDDRLPLPYVKRAVGAFFGYGPLMTLFHNVLYAKGDLGRPNTNRHTLWLESEANLLMRTLRNEVNNFDTVNIIGNNITHEKMLYDTKASEKENNPHRDTVELLLAQHRPVLIQDTMSIDQHLLANQGNMESFIAKKNIAEHGQVTDHGNLAAIAQWGKTKEDNLSGK